MYLEYYLITLKSGYKHERYNILEDNMQEYLCDIWDREIFLAIRKNLDKLYYIALKDYFYENTMKRVRRHAEWER